MNPRRWKLNRAGFFNFWKHEETEFIFEDGKILFHGHNGSGKTMSMTSLITPVLDGKTSPERLDPFESSKSRKMRDILLGKQNASLTDSRIGYFYTEYQKGNSNQYLTTIVGLEAVVNKVTPKFWGCLVLNNRRIVKGLSPLYLYNIDEATSQKIPFSKKELEVEIGKGGLVTSSQEEYMSLVNRHLFGFSSIQKYQDFIKLLIQLRTPKLSSAKTTGIKPSTLNEILRDSLPEITMDDLRPLIETIETIDNLKQDMDQQKVDHGLLKGIAAPYEVYNDLLLYIKAKNYIEAERRLRTQKAKEQELKNQLKEKADELKQTEEEISKLDLKLQATEETILSLQSNQDIFSLQKEQTGIMNEQEEQRKMLEQAQKEFEQTQERIKKYKEQKKNLEDSIFSIQSDIGQEMNELKVCADNAGFTEHELLADYYTQNVENILFDFTEWTNSVGVQEAFLKEIWGMAKELEQAKEKRSSIQNDLEQWDNKRKEEVKEREAIEKEYGKKLDELLNDLHGWLEGIQFLTLDTEDEKSLIKLAERLFFSVEEEELTSFLAAKVESTLEKLQAKWLDLQLKVNEATRAIGQIDEEINHWKKGHEPEPERTEKESEVRTQLLREGVPFLPFYKAVKFLPEVKQETRASIEAAVRQSGLLDALIVEEEKEAEVSRLTVVAKTNQRKKSNNLTKYLTVAGTAQPLKEPIIKVLEGISIEEDDAGFILESGQFSSSFIAGQALKEESRYLGEQARRAFRERLLKDLYENRRERLTQQTALNNDLEQLKKEMDFVKDERDEFPSFKALKELKNDIDRKNQWIKEYIDKAIHGQQEQLTKINGVITGHEDKMKLKLKETSFRGETASAVFEQCIAYISEYKGRLINLRHHTETYYAKKQQLNDVGEWRTSLYDTSDSLRDRIKKCQEKMTKAGMRYEQIEKQLAAKGAEEITAQLNEQLEWKRVLPDQMKQLREHENEIGLSISGLKKEVKEVQGKLPFSQNVFTLTETLFTKDPTFPNYRWGEKDIVQQAKELEKQLKEKHKIDNHAFQEKINDTEVLIYAAYNQTFKTIKSFQASLERVVNNREFSKEELSEDQVALVDNILSHENRIEVTMSCIEHGIELDYTPQHAMKKLEDEIAIQELRMSEKDQELYEKFLLQDLRKVIRERISDVGYWISEMNSIMGEVRTSSKLCLTIKWVPTSGDTEEEIHTRKLVSLFNLDSAILNEDEKEQVINHFRSKISRKLQLAEMNGERIRTFKEVIHEVFDYRTWFNFEIHASLKGEDLGHLTNKVYYGLSGGEKALAMYIPLLAAVYSRYSEADADCPRIITLDEAFAGVDDNNISEIFGMLKQMDFDYIYNSQSLWGCYPTVPALAIYDFQNTEDADEVILYRYRWNGISKEYLGPAMPSVEPTSQISFRDIIGFDFAEGETDEQSS